MKPVYVFGSKTKPTNELNTTDSFVTNAVNLCLMLRDDFDIKLVGLPGSEVIGVETIPWELAITHLASAPDTAVVCITGPDYFHDAIQLPQTICEPTRGYDMPAFTRHIAFPSWAWLHFSAGFYQTPEGWQNWTVVPHAIVEARYTFSNEKDDYVLYLGRLHHGKGLDVAIEACRLAGMRIVVAGAKYGEESEDLLRSGVEYAGFADYDLRKQLLAKAKALIYPTPGVEPFSYTVLEANVSGTPAIVTNRGAFTETVRDGVNGFRCKDAADMTDALKQVETFTPEKCRAWAIDNFGIAKVQPQMVHFMAGLDG